MRHDYDLPPDWESLTDAEKSAWMTQERCRRQAKQQTTAASKRMEKRKERFARRLDAVGYERTDENK